MRRSLFKNHIGIIFSCVFISEFQRNWKCSLEELYSLPGYSTRLSFLKGIYYYGIMQGGVPCLDFWTKLRH